MTNVRIRILPASCNNASGICRSFCDGEKVVRQHCSILVLVSLLLCLASLLKVGASYFESLRMYVE